MDNNEFDFDFTEAVSEQQPQEDSALADSNEQLHTRPKNRYKQSKWLTKEKIRIYLFALAALVLVLAVLFISLYIKSDKVDKALDSEQYNRVQVAITQSVEYVETESSEQQTDEESSVPDGAIYGDGSYYYDENGNLVTDEQQEQEVDNTSTYELGIIKVDGDTVYEKNDYSESYRFTRDGERFVIYYYEDFLASIMKEEDEEVDGEWVEVYEKNYGSIASFDFSVMDKYVESDFKKVDDYYAPKGSQEEIFIDFLQIKQLDKYSNHDMKFYFENGKVKKIVASYTYSNTMNIVQTYKFTYDNEKLEIPKPDKVYDIDGNLVEGKADEK